MNARTLALFFLAALHVPLAFANLIDDPSFELATHASTTSNSAWNLSVNMPDGANLATQFHDFAFAAQDGEIGVWFRSFEGASEPGDALAQATLEQSIVAAVGGDYALTFWAKREAFFSAASWGVSLSSNGTGGAANLDLLSDAPNDGSWNQYNRNLSGVTAGDILTINGTMVDGVSVRSNPQSAFLDNFSLVSRTTDVPEPNSILLSGLAFACATAARKKSSSPR